MTVWDQHWCVFCDKINGVSTVEFYKHMDDIHPGWKSGLLVPIVFKHTRLHPTPIKDCHECQTAPSTTFGVRFHIIGQVYSLKNSKLLTARGGRIRSIKHPRAQKFASDFLRQVPAKYRSLKLGGPTKPLRTIVTVFYPSYRQDLDCGAIYDLLHKAGVISNDRWIREKVEHAEIDRQHPRCEITVEFI